MRKTRTPKRSRHTDPLLPCASCPFRTNRDAAVIPRYNSAKACNLMNTVGEGDDFRPIMACHHSSEQRPVACNGYLARHGWSNINARILLWLGQIASPADVLAACEKAGVELHADYPAVLAKLNRT